VWLPVNIATNELCCGLIAPWDKWTFEYLKLQPGDLEMHPLFGPTHSDAPPIAEAWLWAIAAFAFLVNVLLIGIVCLIH
jgi:hypothetical protein